MTISAKASFTSVVDITLSESEARSINDLSSFGGDQIVKALAGLSPAWARDYGPALVVLINRIRESMGPELDRITAARHAFRHPDCVRGHKP